MRKVFLGFLGLAGIGALLLAGHQTTRAADHRDAPGTQANSACDITDVYSWMSADGNNVILAMDLFAEELSNTCQYVFHVGSRAEFLGADAANTMIICQYDDGNISCWVGEPNNPTGGTYQTRATGAKDTTVTSDDGKLKVYAGLRDDPFFFNLAGFLQVVGDVTAAAPNLTPDDQGCPAVDAATSADLVAKLAQDGQGQPAVDTFAGANVAALVVELDKTLVNSGGPVLAIWGSTRQR